MCIACNPSQPADFYAARDPYNYGITASARQMSVHATEFISKNHGVSDGGKSSMRGRMTSEDPSNR